MNNPEKYKDWERAVVVRPFTARATTSIVPGITKEREVSFQRGQIVHLCEWRPEGMIAAIRDLDYHMTDCIFLFFRHFDNLARVEQWRPGCDRGALKNLQEGG